MMQQTQTYTPVGRPIPRRVSVPFNCRDVLDFLGMKYTRTNREFVRDVFVAMYATAPDGHPLRRYAS